jgi:DNA modification methylase
VISIATETLQSVYNKGQIEYTGKKDLLGYLESLPDKMNFSIFTLMGNFFNSMAQNTIFNEDCIVGMSDLPNDSVDLIIADPPYNLSKGGVWKWDNSVKLSGMGGNWNKVMQNWDNIPFEKYMQFTEFWLMQTQRILKSTGSMWIFGTYHNIGVINVICQKLGIEIINEVIWYKRNAFPNLSGKRLTASHETILWCNKGCKKRKYYFDYEYSKNSVFPEDGLKTKGKQMRTVWDIPNNKLPEEIKYGKHPTQKPLRILDRIIRLSSKKGDLVMTPFSGSGSECVAAKLVERNYLGFEIDKEYYNISIIRLSKAKPKNGTTLFDV